MDMFRGSSRSFSRRQQPHDPAVTPASAANSSNSATGATNTATMSDTTTNDDGHHTSHGAAGATTDSDNASLPPTDRHAAAAAALLMLPPSLPQHKQEPDLINPTIHRHNPSSQLEDAYLLLDFPYQQQQAAAIVRSPSHSPSHTFSSMQNVHPVPSLPLPIPQMAGRSNSRTFGESTAENDAFHVTRPAGTLHSAAPNTLHASSSPLASCTIKREETTAISPIQENDTKQHAPSGDHPQLAYATSAPTDDEELMLAAQVLLHTQSMRARGPTPWSDAHSSPPFQNATSNPTVVGSGDTQGTRHFIKPTKSTSKSGSRSSSVVRKSTAAAPMAIPVSASSALATATSTSPLSASFPRAKSDRRRNRTTTSGTGITSNSVGHLSALSNINPTISWIASPTASDPSHLNLQLNPPLEDEPSSPMIASYQDASIQQLPASPSRALSPLTATAGVSPNSKASKQRWKATEARLAASSLAGSSSSTASLLLSNRSGNGGSIRKKRNPLDRDESVERKSVSPSPSPSRSNTGVSSSHMAQSASSISHSDKIKAVGVGHDPMATDTTDLHASAMTSSTAGKEASADARSTATPQANTRQCNYCHATTTPMWRHGPPGYPDLCNKCGVKWMRGRILQGRDTSSGTTDTSDG